MSKYLYNIESFIQFMFKIINCLHIISSNTLNLKTYSSEKIQLNETVNLNSMIYRLH